jgi:N-acetylglutamate synthase-like GNAT family acetyltransferase
MEIRKFKEDDANLVSEIIWSALIANNSKDYGQDILLNLKTVYSPKQLCALSQTRTFLVVENEGKIIGVGAIEQDFISSVFVDPNKQGKGIGRLIMNALEAIAKEKQYECVFLHSSLTAESFYTKINYHVEKRNTDPFYGENILMKKTL